MDLSKPISLNCSMVTVIQSLIQLGVYSIKMELEGPIPQFLPMNGKKIKIFHRGIKIQCHKYYGNHPIRNSRNNKVHWTEWMKTPN